MPTLKLESKSGTFALRRSCAEPVYLRSEIVSVWTLVIKSSLPNVASVLRVRVFVPVGVSSALKSPILASPVAVGADVGFTVTLSEGLARMDVTPATFELIENCRAAWTSVFRLQVPEIFTSEMTVPSFLEMLSVWNSKGMGAVPEKLRIEFCWSAVGFGNAKVKLPFAESYFEVRPGSRVVSMSNVEKDWVGIYHGPESLS